MTRPQGKEKTHRGFLWAGVIGFGLLSVPGKGANDQKEGEKQTQGKIP